MLEQVHQPKMGNVLVIAEEALAHALGFLLEQYGKAECVIAESVEDVKILCTSPNNYDNIMIQATLLQKRKSDILSGSEDRTFGSGILLAQCLRRDYRYRGKIIICSYDPLEVFLEQYSFLHGLSDRSSTRWNMAFYHLPRQTRDLTHIEFDSVRMSEADLVEFVTRFCELDAYFASGWSRAAHRLKKETGIDWLEEPGYTTLIQNTLYFGSGWAQHKNKSSLNTSRMLATLSILPMSEGRDSAINKERIATAIDHIVNWLRHDPLPSEERINTPDRAPAECQVILLADDEGYDSRGLESRGYRVLHALTPKQACEDLSEYEPDVFLCDLTWNDNPKTGLELVEKALCASVPIVILMSVGIIPGKLPKGVIPCFGRHNKQNSDLIHLLIVSGCRNKSRR